MCANINYLKLILYNSKFYKLKLRGIKYDLLFYNYYIYRNVIEILRIIILQIDVVALIQLMNLTRNNFIH